MKKLERLDHKKYQYAQLEHIVDAVDELCERLDQQHPLERKIRFLLDVRGYLKLNKLEGSYVEFGCFRAEMLFAASRILKTIGLMRNFVGLDTFTGEPEPNAKEHLLNPSVQSGDFACDFEEVKRFLKTHVGDQAVLIQGDFRKQKVLERCTPYARFNISVVDCNILSSIETSVGYSMDHLINGGLLFIDDYFTNLGDGCPHITELLEEQARKHGRSIMDHGFYPPFAKSFIVF